MTYEQFLMSKIHELNAENRELKQKYEDAKDYSDSLKRQNDFMTKQRANLVDTNIDLRGDIERLNRELRSCEAELEKSLYKPTTLDEHFTQLIEKVLDNRGVGF